MYIDKDLVKERVPIHEAIDLLGLKMVLAGNIFRGACPCGYGDHRSFTITPSKGLFFCGGIGSGDVIKLVMHVRGVSFTDALRELADFAGIDTGTSSTGRTVPSNRSRERQEPESGRDRSHSRQPRAGGKPSSPAHQFNAAEYAEKLNYEHELLTEIGGDPERLREFGVGFSTRGIHRQKIVIRVYNPESGEEAFVAVEGEISLPPQLKTNVYPLKRRA